nr:disease resistance-like protein CSA1 [Ziziphus jujuba var. spinosa]
MDSLKSLSLSACASIDMFPSLPRFLSRLDISGTPIKAVPSSVDELSGLVKFYLKGCKRLESLPTRIYNLKALTFLSLSVCSKLRYIPEISKPLESLRFLHLDETRSKEPPSSIGNLKGLTEENLDNCCKLKALPDSINKLNNTEHFSLFGCSKLEKFPTLSTSLANSNACQHSLDLKFFNCMMLDHEASRGIMADVHIRILRMAASTLKAKNEFPFFASPSLRIWCPGNEIPDWFTYQTEGDETPDWFTRPSKGSSLNIQLPLNWHSNLLGIALCIVVAFRNCDRNLPLWISCKCSLKRNNGVGHKFNWFMNWNRMMASKTWGVAESDHMFLWYDHSIFEDFIKKQANFFSSTCNATFIFNPVHQFSTITKCGINLLYAQDAERLGILSQDDREPDVEHNTTKRSRNAFEAGGGVIFISSDKEEEDDQPNPKRI